MNLADPIYLMVAYILGSVNTSYYWVKWKTQKDIRKEYTGTAGATNVSRILGKKGFITVFGLDVLKGLLIISVAQYLKLSPTTTSLSLFFLCLGHSYPAQLQFKGGKSIAVFTGGIYLLDPLLALAITLLLVIGVKIFQSKNRVTLVVFVLLAIVYNLRHTDFIFSLGITLSCLLISWKHRHGSSISV